MTKIQSLHRLLHLAGDPEQHIGQEDLKVLHGCMPRHIDLYENILVVLIPLVLLPCLYLDHVSHALKIFKLYKTYNL